MASQPAAANGFGAPSRPIQHRQADAYLAWGNMDSVSAPYKMRFYSETGGGSVFDTLICMTLCSLPGVAIIYLTRFNSKLLAAKVAALLALTALGYLGSLHFAGRKFERDWWKLIHRLS